jgi:hypothetical protein
MLPDAISFFFENIFDQLITYFSATLADIMGTAVDVLRMPLVQNGIFYAQSLAFTILVVKGMAETMNTYILHKNGDPDADPKGLLIGIGQAVAIISTLPWIVTQVFIFGTKVASDVANLSSGKAGITDWAFMTVSFASTGGIIVWLFGIFIVIALLVVAIQATIRGAELALMAVVGPIMALNLTSNNTNVWSAWFKQLLVLTLTQALQIFMLKGVLSLLTSQAISSGGLLLVFGWVWVTIKTPKFLQQFAHSTGFTGAVGGGAKQAGSMYMMRKMMTRA